MIKEFVRVLKQPIVVTLYLVLIGGIIMFSFLYASRSDQVSSYRSPGNYVSTYIDVEEIPDRIDSLRLSIEQLDKDDTHYERIVKIYEDSIMIYQYLYDNGIEYDNYAQPSMLQGYQDNGIRFMGYHMEVLLSGLIFFLIVLALSFVNYEHATGVYKFIYGTEKKRLAIIKNKFLAYILHVSLILLITVSLLYLFSNALNQPFDWIILIWNNKVYGFTTEVYKWLILGSIPLVVLFYSIGFFSLALLSKNIFMALILCITFLGVFQGLFFYLDYPYLQTFAQFPIGIFEMDVSVIEAITIYGIKYSLLIILFVISLVYFNEKDLL